MATIRIPTPLRPYSGGNAAVSVSGETVGEALADLTTRHPELRTHLFEGRDLRSFVNVYLNKEDIRHLNGADTAIEDSDTLMIIPSIAGGSAAAGAGTAGEASPRRVDQSALRVNQALIIALLLLAYVLDAVWLVAFVATVMLLGTAVPQLQLFKQVYQYVLKPAGAVKPDVINDNPEPHRFAQGFGGVVLIAAVVALFGGLSAVSWALTGLVVILAALNLFLGFCAGCFVYYQLNRLGLPGFSYGPLAKAGRDSRLETGD
jgi:molybdopterin converting factor small subunit